MKKIVFFALALMPVLASAYELEQNNENETVTSNPTVSATETVLSATPEVETPATNTWGAKLHESPFSLILSAQTKYMWRGMEMQVEEAAPVLFPSVGFSAKGFYAYFTGGYALNGKYAEVDFGASYTWKWLTIGINDYYYPTVDNVEDDYYTYKSHQTGHWLEGVITIAPEKIPASLTVSNFFAGADKNLEGKQAYSTYAELSTWYDFLNDHRLSATCGMAFNKSCYNGYAHNFGVCNVELKYTYNITFKNGSTLPLSCAYITNPVYKKSYVNITATLTL